MASSVNSIYNAGRLRLTGMSSGLDTDSIISSIMKVEQLKVDKQFKSMTKKEFKRDALKEVNKQIQALRDEFMSSIGASASKNVLSSANYKSYSVTSDDKDSRATMTASGTALSGTYTLNSVKQLATANKIESGKLSTANHPAFSTSATLDHLNQTGMLPNIFRTNGDTTGELTINGEKIEYSATDSLQQVMNRVNSNSKAGVTMSYSQLTESFSITDKKTGSISTLDVSDSGGLLQAMGMAGTTQAVLDASGNQVMDANGLPAQSFKADVTSQGKNAIVYINGTRVESVKNDITIDGMTFNLKKVFNENYDPTDKTKGDGTDINFEVKRDTSKALGVIKDFVAGYNKLMTSLQAIIGEKPNKSYEPLTDEEREELSEKQAEKWDTESKKGTLYRDSSIEKLMTDMRRQFFDKISDTGLTMADIGVGPAASVVDKVYVGTSQEITVDEEKLTKWLEEDPDRVAKMFNAGNAFSDSEMKQAGLANRFIKLTNNYKSTTSAATTEMLDEEIRRNSSRLYDMRNRMAEKEELLYKKYAAMESALTKMQSQSSWIASQLG